MNEYFLPPSSWNFWHHHDSRDSSDGNKMDEVLIELVAHSSCTYITVTVGVVVVQLQVSVGNW